MLLPSGAGPANKLSMYDFRRTVVDHCLPAAQIFFLLDCCSDTQMKLPYKMIDDRYKLAVDRSTLERIPGSSKPLNLTEVMKSVKFSSQDVVCLSSASNDGSSHITEKGSFFTNGFFSFVTEKRLLKDLIPVIQEHCDKLKKQEVTCYASDPKLGVIWGWLLGLPDIICQFNCQLQSLTITTNDYNDPELDICVI